MSRKRESTAFTAALAVTLTTFLILAWRLESAGRLGPILLAAGALALVGWQLVRDLRETKPKAVKPRPAMQATGFAWALALPPTIYLLGCLGGIAVHTLLLVRFRGRRSWGLAALLAAVAALPVYGLAEMMARRELLAGALWKWF